MSLEGTSVLVVEDESDFRIVLAGMLDSLGVKDVGMADGVPAAIEQLGERAYDLLLTDLRLGNGTGMELVEIARAQAPAMRSVLISAHASARDVEVARDQGVVEVLTKPFTTDRLESALRKALASTTGLWGEVQELSLLDMLQMYHYGRRSLVVALSGEVEGRITFDNGEIVDATAGELRGLAALSQLLRMTTGLVRTEIGAGSSERTIEADFQSTLLEALRLLDEENRSANDSSEHEMELALAGLASSGINGSSAALESGREINASTNIGTIEHSSILLDLERSPQGERIMATEKQLQEALQKIQAEISGYIGASVVDLETGMTLAVLSARPDFDLSTASAYNSEMVKQKLKIIKALNLKTTLEDMLLTLGDQIHLIKIVTPGTFLYLAAERASTNLAIVRAAVLRHTAELQ